MIRERSAGPRMIFRFEHKSHLMRGSVCSCFVQSLPYVGQYQELSMNLHISALLEILS